MLPKLADALKTKSQCCYPSSAQFNKRRMRSFQLIDCLPKSRSTAFRSCWTLSHQYFKMKTRKMLSGKVLYSSHKRQLRGLLAGSRYNELRALHSVIRLLKRSCRLVTNLCTFFFAGYPCLSPLEKTYHSVSCVLDHSHGRPPGRPL